jgi:hypothetical protein
MKPAAVQRSLGASDISIETDTLDTDCFLMDDESPSDEYIVMLATDGVPGLREYLCELSR